MQRRLPGNVLKFMYLRVAGKRQELFIWKVSETEEMQYPLSVRGDQRVHV